MCHSLLIWMSNIQYCLYLKRHFLNYLDFVVVVLSPIYSLNCFPYFFDLRFFVLFILIPRGPWEANLIVFCPFFQNKPPIFKLCLLNVFYVLVLKPFGRKVHMLTFSKWYKILFVGKEIVGDIKQFFAILFLFFYVHMLFS